ncbi:ABC transporter permease [Nitriliruptor alkaliphilus]|uniref:ABC transporter permease n=1 Tax=Nitriliruptor alkaliphilus TaxID=427918 RepID=UPI0006987B60|nr:ABC transporter permease [Nitriliruptor alkaliphilus]
MTTTLPPVVASRPEPRRFEPRTVAAIVHREWRVFRRVWFSTAFGSVAEPILYFVAFGYGFGALVASVAGLDYLDFIATGAIAIGILFSSAFPGLINGYFRRKEQHLYDGILAAPVSVAEIVTGEALWNSFRVTVVAVVTTLVAFAFGVRPGIGVLLVPAVSVVGGFGFACAGAAFGALLRSTHGFDFVIVGVIVPMYVVAGTFFPLDTLPTALATIGQVNPLTHVVELLRILTFGTGTALDALGHLGVVLVFDLLAWAAAVRLLKRALVT